MFSFLNYLNVIENKEINGLNNSLENGDATCCTRSRESDSSLHFSGPLVNST